MRENIRVMVEQLFSVKAGEYLRGEVEPNRAYRFDNIKSIFEVKIRRGIGGHWDTNHEATKKNLLSVINAGYLIPVTDLKGDVTADAKQYRILRFEEDCSKICTEPPGFIMTAEHSYYGDTEKLEYLRYEKIDWHDSYRRYYGYVWAHQEEYIILKNDEGTSFFSRALLPDQAKLVALTYVDLLLDRIKSSGEINHAATLNLYADIHEVLAADLRAQAAGTITHGYKHSQLLPLVMKRAPLLLNSPVQRVREAAKWLLEHPECANWDHVKDVWPEPTEEEG